VTGHARQYGGLAAVLAAGAVAGYWGFAATGGALPYAKRFGRALAGGVSWGGGPLVDVGRGVVVAGPIRKGGLVPEFLAIAAALAAVGVALFLYAERARRTDEGPDRAR
jgi:hypothetical protein